MSEDRTGFLGRWSRRKAEARVREAEETRTQAEPAADPVTPPAQGADAAPVASASPSLPESDAPALPTLEDVAALTHDSDYSAFVKRAVAPDVRNAAMKKLFSDPHFNIMDGLDIYIDDYSNPEVMPRSMLRELASAQVLNLLTEEEAAAKAAADAQQAQQFQDIPETQSSPASDIGHAYAAEDIPDMVDSPSPQESTRVDGPASPDEALPSPDSIAPASKPYPSGQA